jgi:hypothetical protein
MLANLPPSHSKLFALLGCDSMALLLVAAAKPERMRVSSTELTKCQVVLQRCTVIYADSARRHQLLKSIDPHHMHQHERLAHYFVPALLRHFATKLVASPAHSQAGERLTVEELVMLSATASSVPQVVVSRSYLPYPADLQQVLLQDLLPMVAQISSTMLDLSGPAAYRPYSSSSSSSSGSSSSMQSSTAARPIKQLADSNKLLMAASLISVICSAALPCHNSPTLVPAAALGSHVLLVGQLCEAAVRLSWQAAGLAKVLPYLQPLCGTTVAVPGALVEVVGSAAAAEAARVSVDDARQQLTSLCCSILKVATVGTASADGAYHAVASVLMKVTCPACLAGIAYPPDWNTELTASSVVPWLAISGRVLQHFAARQQDTVAITTGPGTGATISVIVPEPVLQVLPLAPLRNLNILLSNGPVSQQLSADGYDVASLRQRIEVLMESVPGGYTTASLNREQVAALQSLGIALTNQAFPCACNNPACKELAGPLELQLVNGRSCMCGGCRVAHYCCRDCQRRHWKQHKPVCQALAAQASAATT